MADNVSTLESFVETLKYYCNDPSHPITPSQLHTPNDPSFSTILFSHVRNLRFAAPHAPSPFIILTPTHISHVQAAVISARRHNLLMKIRSGGHDYEGLSYSLRGRHITPFLLLDMQHLCSVEIDVGAEAAWVQTGATLGELFHEIYKQSRVYGFPAGVCPTVGVGGHLSGGGYGSLMRKYGLSVDHVVDALVVDAFGKVLDRETMGEDLFWAIRGGGGASFCVVVSYKVKLVKVPEDVTVFKVELTLARDGVRMSDAVYRWQEVAPKLDDGIFIRMWLDVVEKSTVRASFVGLFLGGSERLLTLMNEGFSELGLKRSDCVETSWVRSVLFFADMPIDKPLEDYLLPRKPQKLVHLKRKSDYLKEPIPRAGLSKLFEKMIELEFPILGFNPYGGQMARIADDATPFPHRKNMAKIQYVLNWNESGKEAANYYIGLVRKLYEFMTPFVSKNPRESYFNYRDLDLGINEHDDPRTSYDKGRDYGIKYFKGNFQRLVEIKSKVDPANFFRNEQSIPGLPLASI